MVKKCIVLILFTFSSCIQIFAASDSLHFSKSIITESRFFTTDPIGNIYVVKNNNALIKYNANGDSIGIYSEVRKGKITHIDATNPLRVLVYFGNYNQIVILDNMLSTKSIMKLQQLGLQNIRCVATSKDGRVWIYDPVEARLLKIDELLEIQFSTPLRNVLPDQIDPNFMVEQDRNLYVVDSLKGIYKFDLFGFYNATYDFKTKEVQRFNYDLVYTQNNELISYNTQTISEKKMQLPNKEDVLQVRVEKNKVYIRRSKTIDIYDL